MSVSSVAALSPWTDEYVETAGKLWADGWSATQISKELRRRFGLAVTRNAVIGVLHRRGLAGRGVASRPTTYSDRPPPRPKRPKANRRVRIAAHGTFVEPTPRPPRVVIPFRQDTTGTRTILTVGLGECRWPAATPCTRTSPSAATTRRTGRIAPRITPIASRRRLPARPGRPMRSLGRFGGSCEPSTPSRESVDGAACRSEAAPQISARIGS